MNTEWEVIVTDAGAVRNDDDFGGIVDAIDARKSALCCLLKAQPHHTHHTPLPVVGLRGSKLSEVWSLCSQAS